MSTNAIIDAYRPFLKTWTPTIVGQGGSVWTGAGTYNNATYFMLGRVCFWMLDQEGALAANQAVRFTLPVQPLAVDTGAGTANSPTLFNFASNGLCGDSSAGPITVPELWQVTYITATSVHYGLIMGGAGTDSSVKHRFQVGGFYLTPETA